MRHFWWAALVVTSPAMAVCNVDVMSWQGEALLLRVDCGTSIVRSISLLSNGVEMEKITPYKPLKVMAYALLREPPVTTTYTATAITQTTSGSGSVSAGKGATVIGRAVAPPPLPPPPPPP